jgi:hypothetical protein
MTGTVVVTRAEPADEGAVLLVQEPTALIAIWTPEPWALPLLTAKGPFLLKLYDLGLAVEGDGDLSSTQTASA